MLRTSQFWRAQWQPVLFPSLNFTIRCFVLDGLSSFLCSEQSSCFYSLFPMNLFKWTQRPELFITRIIAALEHSVSFVVEKFRVYTPQQPLTPSPLGRKLKLDLFSLWRASFLWGRENVYTCVSKLELEICWKSACEKLQEIFKKG